jgi:hypothetical protein
MDQYRNETSPKDKEKRGTTPRICKALYAASVNDGALVLLFSLIDVMGRKSYTALGFRGDPPRDAPA